MYKSQFDNVEHIYIFDYLIKFYCYDFYQYKKVIAIVIAHERKHAITKKDIRSYNTLLGKLYN